jgi:hypothetical protein
VDISSIDPAAALNAATTADAALPDPARRAVNELVKMAARKGFLALVARLRSNEEEQARRLAIASAAQAAIEGRSELEVLNLASALTREPFASTITQILGDPGKPIDALWCGVRSWTRSAASALLVSTRWRSLRMYSGT